MVRSPPVSGCHHERVELVEGSSSREVDCSVACETFFNRGNLARNEDGWIISKPRADEGLGKCLSRTISNQEEPLNQAGRATELYIVDYVKMYAVACLQKGVNWIASPFRAPACLLCRTRSIVHCREVSHILSQLPRVAGAFPNTSSSMVKSK